MSHLALYLLGLPRVEVDGKEVHIGRRKAVALLSYLAVTNRMHSRDGLAAFFWPDYVRPQALAYLRRVVSELNSLLGDFALEVDRDTCGINQKALWLDVSEFRKHLTTCESHNHLASAVCEDCIKHLEKAAKYYRGDFLEGLTLPDSSTFDEWQFFQTESLRRDFAVVLERLTTWHHAHKNFTTALPYAKRWLALDPLHEPAHRSLMELYADAGQKSAALHQYQLCVKTLDRELNIAPSGQTTALYEYINSHPATIQSPKTSSPDIILQRVIGQTILNNFPAQLTSFIGREKEISEVQKMLLRPDVRLLTLTGPGGTGKTRLGIAVTEQVLNEFPDGVVFVSLASLRDPTLVLNAIAQALELRDSGDMVILDILHHYLDQKQILLVVDNFEHVTAAAVDISTLLTSLPLLKILVTSRAVLQIRGEHIYYVKPLSITDEDTLDCRYILAHSEAVQLFVDRLTALSPSFALSEDNVEIVVNICKRLDGLPLAIELAVARTRLLSPQELLLQLENPLSILTDGAVDLPDRQRTLRSTIAWSYNLLDSLEQSLFCKLAVFIGGCTFDAVKAVSSLTSHQPAENGYYMHVLTRLDSLLKYSLIQQIVVDGTKRFSMLETVREFALEQLPLHCDANTIQNAYAEYYLNLAKVAAPHIDGPEPAIWMLKLERERDNLRAVLEWSLKHDITMGLRLVSALELFWIFHASITEGRDWISKLINHPEVANTKMDRLRAYALRTGCELAWHQGDSATGIEMGRQSVAIFRALGDKRDLAYALKALGENTLSFPDSSETLPLVEEGIALFRELNDKLGLSKILFLYGTKLNNIAEYQRARVIADECYELAQEIGAVNPLIMALRLKGYTAIHFRSPDTARQYFEEGLKLSRQTENKFYERMLLLSVAESYYNSEEMTNALSYLEKVVEMCWQVGNRAVAVMSLSTISHIALVQGDITKAKSVSLQCLTVMQDVEAHNWLLPEILHNIILMTDIASFPERVAIFLGVIETFRSKTLTGHEQTEKKLRDLYQLVLQYLDEQTYTKSYTSGLSMSREQAIDFALSELQSQ